MKLILEKTMSHPNYSLLRKMEFEAKMNEIGLLI